MLRILVIEDEPRTARTLVQLLAECDPTIVVESCLESIEASVTWLKEHTVPDLIFMDIQLSDGLCFAIFNRCEVACPVIFTTAYDEYALQAFTVNSIDYLLKPVDPEDLAEAVKKAEKLVIHELNQQLGTLADNMQTPDKAKKKIILKTFDNIHLVKLQDILYCECQDNYTNFYLLNGKKILVSNTLKEYDEMLSEFGFFRIHKSYLINLIHIDRFEKAEGGVIVLENEIKLPVASRKKEQLLEMIQRITEI